LLHKTGGICPVTRCAKGLMNGPCGGMKNGKCEIGNDQDCGWYLIYEKLKKLGRLDEMRRIIPSKSKSLVTKPKKMPIAASITICPIEEEEIK
ncbi:MAG: methylenetetrahydrofolate reductase C-terminal domain-containing protein, partial [Candidatus Hydrothermarchaeota archaeon]|nr:methylenetetrahydrofolate reductase C-terminal domain-containing protein [Candidatus Hydrothermarchaeota archaeon]